MAIKKIPCGGWLYDDEQITFEDGVMKVIGGGGITEAPIDGKQYARKDAEWSEVQSGGGGGMVVTVDFDESFNGVADKTLDEIIAAFNAGAFVSIKMLVEDEFNLQAPLMLTAYGEPGDRGIEASLEIGKVKLRCQSGTTWTMH